MTSNAFNLIPFPGQNDNNRLQVEISGCLQLNKAHIDISFLLKGNIDALQIPAKALAPSRKDKLWENTCFEVFITKPVEPDYWEYNVSPSQDWAVFHFSEYRLSKMDELSIGNIEVTSYSAPPNQYTIQSKLPLPEALHAKNLQVGISTVLQDREKTIYYYALAHLRQNPDFHDRNSFTLLLNAES